MKLAYPNLEVEILKRGIKKSTIYSCLGISGRCFYNKMSGLVPITWPEACKIQENFFPDISKEYLFSNAKDIPDKAS